MSTIPLDIDKFRLQFPEFASESDYPDAQIQTYWDNATCYISDEDSNCFILSGKCRELAICYMTAHLLKIGTDTTAGDGVGFVNSSTIDKVSVSVTPPPQKDQFEWWLSLTPYGQLLLALLESKAAGGLFVGGSLTRAGFRGPTGFFNG